MIDPDPFLVTVCILTIALVAVITWADFQRFSREYDERQAAISRHPAGRHRWRVEP